MGFSLGVLPVRERQDAIRMRTRFAALLASLALAYKVPQRDLASRVAELETRLAAFGATMDACCETTSKPWGVNGDLEVMVELRKDVAALKERVKALEGDDE